MKMKYILLSLLLVGFAPGYAQFGGLKKGLRKIKRKRKSVKKKKEKAQGRVDGEPVNNDRDPISRAHESAKYKLARIEDAISKDGWEKAYFSREETWIQSYFRETRKGLDRLKANSVESKKPYYKKHEEKYARLFKAFNAVSGGVQAAKKRENFFKNYTYKVKGLVKNGTERYYKPKNRPNYAEYKKKRDEYLASKDATSEVKKDIALVDKFYAEDIDKVCIPRMLKRLNRYNGRYFKAKDHTEPKKIIESLKSSRATLAEWQKIVASKNESLEKNSVAWDNEIKRWEAYISSGKHAAYLKKLEQKKLNSVRLGTVGTRNAQMEALVRRAYAGKNVQRVVITTTRWGITKNKLTSRPKYMYHHVYVALKGSNGKCYRNSANIKKDYLGGGSYGKMYVEKAVTWEQMNCANVNK